MSILKRVPFRSCPARCGRGDAVDVPAFSSDHRKRSDFVFGFSAKCAAKRKKKCEAELAPYEAPARRRHSGCVGLLRSLPLRPELLGLVI